MHPAIFADLHNHTRFSDGDYTPEELICLARKSDIPVIGITDHDTLAGLPEALAAGEKHKVKVIPGVEVSVRFKRPDFIGTLHLLCYFSAHQFSDPIFVNAFNRILAQGRGEMLVRARINEINAVFGPDGSQAMLNREMAFEDIAGLSDNATRRHFALALEKSFDIRDKEIINRIIGNDSPAYLPSGVVLSSLSGLLADYDMVVSLAHPAAGSFPGEGHYREVLPPVETVEALLPEFLDCGMNAIEVYYPGHTPAHQALMAQWAETHNLVMTGGSDCHDETHRPFGVRGLPEADYQLFESRLATA